MRKEFLLKEERIPLIKSVHRLCELRRAKRLWQAQADEWTREGMSVAWRKCKRCGESFPVIIPRQNRKLRCDECAHESRLEKHRLVERARRRAKAKGEWK